MALRMVEIVAPDTQRDALDRELEDLDVRELWREPLLEDQYRIRLIFRAEDVEPVTDALSQRFSSVDGFRMIIFEVEATIPRLDEEEEEDDKEAEKEESGAPEEEEKEQRPSAGRISREELHADLRDASRLTPVYFIMLILSAVVAAFGFYHRNIALIIAAMVIAPIIGPNIALAFATTIGDLSLFLRAFLSTFFGALTVFVSTAAIGWIHPIDPNLLSGLSAFYRVELWHILLGFCAGAAGTLSFTRGFSTSLVGVAVAVALLPPMAASGVLLGSGFPSGAGSALLLAVNNVVSIIIAGIATFLLQGIRPMDWWEADKAKRLTLVAIAMWSLLLAALAILTYFVQL